MDDSNNTLVTIQEKSRALQKCALFEGMSDAQLRVIVAIMRVEDYQAGDMLIREGDLSADIYIIQCGQVEVYKASKAHAVDHRIRTLGANDFLGEVAYISQGKRVAHVRATQPTQVYVLSLQQLDRYSTEQEQLHVSKTLYNTLLNNITRITTERLTRMNEDLVSSKDNELKEMTARFNLGLFMVYTFFTISAYTFFLQIVELLKPFLPSMILINIPLIIILVGVIVAFMKHVGFSLADFGFTLNDWQRAVKESILVTGVMVIALIIIKALLIKYVASFHGDPLFQIVAHFRDIGIETRPLKIQAIFWAIYAVLATGQEFVARGVFQGGLEKLLVHRYKTLLAIVVANIAFVMFHLHFSPWFVLITIIPGLIWGWLYARHHTLVGVVLSHIIMGWCAMNIIGFHLSRLV